MIICERLVVSRKGFDRLTEDFRKWLEVQIESEANGNAEKRQKYDQAMLEMMSRFIWGER